MTTYEKIMKIKEAQHQAKVRRGKALMAQWAEEDSAVTIDLTKEEKTVSQ